MKLDNITASRRRYDDACGTALALDLVGDRWALLIVRELMFGGRRFGALKRSLAGISANVLTQRLEGLEEAGIIRRRRLPPPASVQVYELTPWGSESDTAIMALGRWAVRSPRHDPSLPLSAASLMMSFRTMYAGEIHGTVGFGIGEDSFVATMDAGTIAIWRGEPAEAAVTFAGAPEVIASVVYGGRTIAEAETAGELAVTGDRALAARFVTRFPLPPKVTG